MKQAQVKLAVRTNKMLTDLSTQRKEEGHLNSTKQGIVSELIAAYYKRVFKTNPFLDQSVEKIFVNELPGNIQNDGGACKQIEAQLGADNE